MKTWMLSVALGASVAMAQPHHHAHHHHKKHDDSAAEKRDVVVVTEVVAATKTEYFDGTATVDAASALAGISGGLYHVVGSSIPTFTPPPVASPSTTSAAAPSSSIKEAAAFLEKPSSSSAAAPTPSPTSTSTSQAAASSSAASSGSSTSGGTGVDSTFPDGVVDCSTFPSAYGAVPVSWLGTGGWTSIQKVPSFTVGDTSVNNIVAGVSGETCANEGGVTFCSYACPDGCIKTQFPQGLQGATGQSVGGLECKADGKLYKTRSSYSTLCSCNPAGITVTNKLGSNVAVCRTDYPASEAMVIPLDVTPGATLKLANVDSPNYYIWENKQTTLQYYVNPEGVSVSDACVWTSPTNPTSAGNWAPMNIGVGRDASGITYISIFLNTPTSSASLGFDISITGDVSSDCSYKNGAFTSGTSHGCTTGMSSGGSAVITFS